MQLHSNFSQRELAGPWQDHVGARHARVQVLQHHTLVGMSRSSSSSRSRSSKDLACVDLHPGHATPGLDAVCRVRVSDFHAKHDSLGGVDAGEVEDRLLLLVVVVMVVVVVRWAGVHHLALDRVRRCGDGRGVRLLAARALVLEMDFLSDEQFCQGLLGLLVYVGLACAVVAATCSQ